MLQIRHDWVPKRKRNVYGCPALKETEEIPEWARQPRLPKPSPTQSEEGKKLFLQAAASLTERDLLDRVGPEQTKTMIQTPACRTPILRTSAPEDLHRLTPQTFDYII
ncbi:hypothetical protein NDU88_002078 [Pleurodeles waltl]|uniref:Uncharacterized protein n=1 Tax=Pleurodeles waltl TaxID=8319 RepID=A0AAV7U894_PLEWA|nr:hypothetical protein NDU88_002078 [Pleurodeles waltl]